MKKCPYCAEEIQDEAIVCRWCGRDLVDGVENIARSRNLSINHNDQMIVNNDVLSDLNQNEKATNEINKLSAKEYKNTEKQYSETSSKPRSVWIYGSEVENHHEKAANEINKLPAKESKSSEKHILETSSKQKGVWIYGSEVENQHEKTANEIFKKSPTREYKNTEKQYSETSSKRRSVWIYAIVVGFIFACGSFTYRSQQWSNNPNSPAASSDILFGSITSFVLWTLISALLIWLVRKIFVKN